VTVSIGRAVVGSGLAAGWREEAGEDSKAEMDESALELQNRRTTAVRALHYGVLIIIIGRIKERQRHSASYV
jgi:hypothetical protein